MALTFDEMFESGNGSLGDDAGDVYRVLVRGDPVLDHADDEGVIMLAAMPRFSTTSSLLNVISSFSRERIAPGAWIVTATYKSGTEVRQSASSQFSFATSTGAAHITHSRKTVGAYAPPGSALVNHGGAINVSDGGLTVDGLDIGPGTAQGTFEFKTTHYLSVLPQGLVDFISAHPCSVNDSACTITCDGLTLACQPGELQMQYAEGSKRKGFGDWELTFHWAISRNRTNFKVGNITIDNKNGWDYLWVETSPTEDKSGHRLASYPIAAYVEQVYEYINLNLLLVNLTGGAVIWNNPLPS